MSTGPRTQAGVLQGNQSTMEQEASYSTLFFFLQEVSKLHKSSPSAWLSEPGLSSLRKEEHQEEEEEEGHSREVTALIDLGPELCSPWKVMNLIDSQCEQLQHLCNGEDLEPGSDSGLAGLTDQEHAGIDCSVSPFPFISEMEDIAACGLPVEELRLCSQGECCLQPLCRVKHSTMGCCIHSQSSEKSHEAGAEPVKEVKPVNEDEQSVDIPSGRTPEPEDALSEHFYTHTSSPVFLTHLSPDESLTFPSNKTESPALTLDHNANIVLAVEVQPPPPEKCTTFPRRDDSPTAFEAERTSANEESSGCAGDVKPSPAEASKPEARPEQQDEDAPPVRRSKRRRKQLHPSRSADVQDPDFQGVTFRIDTEMDDSREQCHLHITSKYSVEPRKRLRKPRPRTRRPRKALKDSSSEEEESDPMTKDKACRSCGTRRTPMWRDAEDGTPLCNACGIRYKKYRVRCVYCWHIPRKDSTSSSHCLKCGNSVRLTSAPRKPSI